MTDIASAAWRRSSFCNGAATCVEVAPLPDGGVAVRDGKDPGAGQLVFTAVEWAAFTAGVRAGEFDQAALALPVGDGSDGDGRSESQKAATAGVEPSRVSV
ncbi:DUF397 domain-containing protein [Nonomuraea rubra]|uniref:DUF397 domain-containing protein n=1 Tax=Nonomuraea rubra TaxID=46180 RepID=A0A7X0P6J1_9ACTN|nr:DUF397 domain-containing protein [Nonomuraea rubra]MBB6556208.1 hypothetical protein [Nonomuraea rubra]